MPEKTEKVEKVEKAEKPAKPKADPRLNDPDIKQAYPRIEDRREYLKRLDAGDVRHNISEGAAPLSLDALKK